MARNETTPELLTAIYADVKEFAELLQRYIEVTKSTSEEARDKMPIYGFQQIKGALDRMLPKVRGYRGKFDNWERERDKARELARDTHAATKPR